MADEPLTRREAKRLALARASALLRYDAALDPMVLGKRTDAGTPAEKAHDGRLLAAALDEVADEIQRRADRYLQDVTPRKPRTPDVDELLCRLRDLGVDTETVLRSLARRRNHGWHHIAWTHPDGHRETAEASTATLAVTRALKATERRLRKTQKTARPGRAA